MLRGLRLTRLLFAAFLAFAAVTACATLAAAAGPQKDYVVAFFTGDGYAVDTNGTNSDRASGMWWEWEVMPIDLRKPLQIIQPDEIDSAHGLAGEQRSGSPSCTSTHKLLEELRAQHTVGTAAGVRFWTQINASGIGPDPGPDGVLVTASSYLADFQRVTGNCPVGNGELGSVGARWGDKDKVACVVQPNGKCQGTASLPPVTVTCGGSNCSSTYSAFESLTVYRGTAEPDTEITYAVLNVVGRLVGAASGSASSANRALIPPLTIAKGPANGVVSGTVALGSKHLVTTRATVRKGASTTVRFVRTVSAAALQHLTRPTLLTAVATYAPMGQKPVTLTVRFYVLPSGRNGKGGGSGGGGSGGSTPTITSVTFGGSAAKPLIAIHGKNLGSKPAPSPPQHPSGQRGCPAIAGDTGYDYGTSLYVAVPSKNWSGGRSRPSLNELDCLDLVVTRFTASEVDFHFGPFYASAYPQFALAAGTPVQVAVNGATFSTTVEYG